MNSFGESISEVTRVARDAMPSSGEIEGLDDDDLLLLTARAEQLGRVADALRLVAAGEVAARSRRELGEERLSIRRGCTTPFELLERIALVSSATARLRIRVAADLRPRTSLTGETLPATFPRVAAALAAGDIGLDAARAIVGALSPVRDRVGAGGGMDAAEVELVDAAYGSDTQLPAGADEIRIMAQTWALYLDPDGALPDEQKALRNRGLIRGHERDGVVAWRGELLPEVSAQLQTLLDAFLNPKVHDAPGPMFAEGENEVDPLARDPRTPRQRSHDAFAGILHIAAGVSTMPLLGGAPPTLVVTATMSELAATDGIAFVATHEPDETGAVSSAVARHSACLGRVQKIVFGADGQIVELSTAERVFSGHRRRAIATRDGECIIPGCHVPAAWAEVHHVRDYGRGGPTHTDNGVLLCWWHHRTIETSGWGIRMVDGAPWIRAPRWLDPDQRWRPVRGSPQRRLAALAGAQAR